MGTLCKAWKQLLFGITVIAIIIATRQSFRASPASAKVPSFSAGNAGCVAALQSAKIEVSGSEISVSIAPGKFDLGQPAVLAWIKRAAVAVATYYGEFPVAHARVRIVPVEGEDGVSHGTTFGQNGAFTRILVGEHTTAAELDDDWTMTHEFVHLAFPDMPKQHHWIEEGLATYVEPVARVQAGQLKPARVWRDMIRDMPKGEPDAGDRGLDNTHTWARTYWGGALFCLRADIAIRQSTSNRMGLQDALRAIVAKGGTLDKENWFMEGVLKVGDEATGTKVLEQLYGEMKDKPLQVDLANIWAQLGVAADRRKMVFDDRAQLADIRRGITRSPARETQMASRFTTEEYDQKESADESKVP